MTGALRVGGLTPLTTIDFPGRLAAVVFLQGCPWRCGYCQNPELIAADPPVARPQQHGKTAPPATRRRAGGVTSWDEVIAFLQRRRGLLDGVVFSGGEPTLQAGLADAVAQVRELGFEVGLHTAGMYPERLAALLPSLDWVGFDVKAPFDLYDTVTGVPASGVKVRASLDHLLRSGVPHECRTTWHPGLFALQHLQALAAALAELGVAHWAVQTCRVDGTPQSMPPEAVLARLGARFERFCLR
ncbi:MAG TPA: anaerobic ribonucleoside-triphosphate reductase activating protein [Albitalea sp.]